MRISIRSKILAMVVPPMLFVLILSALKLSDIYTEWRTVELVKQLCTYAINVGETIHEIQKERGMTSGFLSGSAQSVPMPLIEQRSATDKQTKALQEKFVQLRSGSNQDIVKIFEQTNSSLSTLSELRNKTEQRTISQPDAISGYTSIINGMIAGLHGVAGFSVDIPALYTLSHTYLDVLQAKERHGRLRATINGILTKQVATRDEILRVHKFVVEADEFELLFKNTATPEMVDLYKQATTSSQAQQVNQTIQSVLRTADVGITAPDPKEWFTLSTRKIDDFKTLENAITKEIVAKSEHIAQSARSTFYFLCALIGLLFIAVLYITYRISREITGSILGLTAYSEEVGNGNFSSSLTITSNDELGDLARAFATVAHNIQTAQNNIAAQNEYLAGRVETMLLAMNQMSQGDLRIYMHNDREDSVAGLYHGMNQTVQNIAVLIRQIIGSANESASASQQLHVSMEQIASAMQDQAHQSSSITDLILQLKRIAEENSTKAAGVIKSVANNNEQAEGGVQLLQQMIDELYAVQKAVEASTTKMRSLESSSNEIREITDLIAEIADQTNLLALNAAIEAARAGDAGRGFAVVADEVRKLAERTSTATKNITSKIGVMLKSTEQALHSIEVGKQTVDSGIQTASSTVDRISDVIKDSIDISASVGDITHAMNTQSQSINTIYSNVESISAAIEEVSSTAIQASQATEMLSRRVFELRSAAEKFTLEDEAHDEKIKLSLSHRRVLSLSK